MVFCSDILTGRKSYKWIDFSGYAIYQELAGLTRFSLVILTFKTSSQDFYRSRQLDQFRRLDQF
jgi:hypothetical protein